MKLKDGVGGWGQREEAGGNKSQKEAYVKSSVTADRTKTD
jgi:hypothetical protein